MINPSSEVHRVVEVLLARIIDGTYPKGLRLPAEAALAEELSCGRSTIREALRHLADLGLVRSRRGSGAMVQDFRREGTPALLPTYLRSGRFDTDPLTLGREMLRLRTMMATEAVRLAAAYAEDAALDEARACLERAPELESDPAAHALNELDFYRALVFASRIYPAAWLVNSLWAPLRELNAVLAPALGAVRPDFQPTMTKLLDHVERGDEAQALVVVTEWFDKVDAAIADLLGATLEATAKPNR
jgi:GntR family transcriptional regulator, transcriptional repressor for pyruvate dehydrogenase complex